MMPRTSANFWKLNLNDRLRLFIWKAAWNLFPTMEWLNAIFSSLDSVAVCPLCKGGEDSIQHLFFKCIFARVIWRHSFWPIDSLSFNFTNMLDWIKVIISPGATLKIPKEDHYRFQILAVVACDFLWSSRNKAYHENLSFDALNLSRKIIKVSLSIWWLGRIFPFQLKKNGCHLRRSGSKSILIQQYEIIFRLKLLCVGIIWDISSKWTPRLAPNVYQIWEKL
jgi:hypothetical protein